ncbi:hypothetical protein ACHAWU_006681 [Discostella pseudostelligera]|uniref:Uncharacterized protein n=1 Tax=Discostella pseudostelligera TaxID=259834 RepID=A0ABD3M0D7_9STRA
MKYSNSILPFVVLAASLSLPSFASAKRDKKDKNKDSTSDNAGQDLRQAATVMAVDDVINLPPGTSEAFIAVLENDSGDNLVIKSMTSPAASGECIISLSLNEVVYTPPSNGFIGSDQCEYEACDTSDMCDTATLTIVIKEELTSGPSPAQGGNVKTLAPTPSFPVDTQVPTPSIPDVTPAPMTNFPTEDKIPDYKPTDKPVSKPDYKPTNAPKPEYPTPDYKPTDAPVSKPDYPTPDHHTPDYYKPTTPDYYTPPTDTPVVYHKPEPVSYHEPEPAAYEPEWHNDGYAATTAAPVVVAWHHDGYESEPAPETTWQNDGYETEHHESEPAPEQWHNDGYEPAPEPETWHHDGYGTTTVPETWHNDGYGTTKPEEWHSDGYDVVVKEEDHYEPTPESWQHDGYEPEHEEGWKNDGHDEHEEEHHDHAGWTHAEWVVDHPDQAEWETYYPTYSPAWSPSSWVSEEDGEGWVGSVHDHDSGKWSGGSSGSWSGSSGGSGKSGKGSKGGKSSKSGSSSENDDEVVETHEHRRLRKNRLRKNRVLYSTAKTDDYYTASYGYTADHIIDHFEPEHHHHDEPASKSGKSSGKSRKLLRSARL